MQLNFNIGSSSTLSLPSSNELMNFLKQMKDDSTISFNLEFKASSDLTRDLLKELFRVVSDSSSIQINWSSELSNEEKTQLESEVTLIGFKLLENSATTWNLQKKNWKSQVIKPKKKLKFLKKKKKNPFAKKKSKTGNKVDVGKLLEKDILAKNEIKGKPFLLFVNF
jgi:hypothetical protein